MLRRIINRVDRSSIIIVLVFLLNLLLVLEAILPEYNEINPFDAAKYIESGRQLVDGGVLREISRSPTLALIYAGIYIFVQNSPNWFVLSAGIGNIILFTILWFATYYFGLRFKKYFSPWVLLGILFTSPALVTVLGNPSDAIFAIFSALALAKTIDFLRNKEIFDLIWASAFVGFAFVSRLDGIYLLPLFILLTFILGFRQIKAYRLLPAILAPAIIVIGLFHITSGITRGDFSTNIGGIAYASLQWYGTTDASATIIGGEKVTETFGTKEETQGSALIAFSRNPSAVVDKIVENLRAVPNQVLLDYGGKKYSPYFFFFALLGLLRLIQKRQLTLLTIFFLWPLNVGLYLPYYTRSGYYLHSMFIPLVLAGIGLTYAIKELNSRRIRVVITAILSLLLIYSIVDNKPAFVAMSAVTFATMLLAWLIAGVETDKSKIALYGFFLTLIGAVILRPPFKFPLPWEVGESPGEEVVHFLEKKLDRGAVVGTYVPKPVVAARMTEIWLYGVEVEDDPVRDFKMWLDRNDVKAFIVEPNFIESYPDIWEAIELSTGETVERVMVADPGSIRVYIPID